MSAVGEQHLSVLLDAVASPSAAPAAGLVAAVVCAEAAALLELTATLAAARLDDGEPMRLLAKRAGSLRSTSIAAAELEVTAYSEAIDAGDMGLAADAPLSIAETAAQVADGAADVAGAGSWPFTPDAVAAVLLAESAASVASLIVAANLNGMTDDPRLARASAALTSANAARVKVEVDR
ncbi:MAG: hypothetical protein F2813_08770 [Actinobacteria bacterium]|uniref:Unannotated protein n=1 Tax=freshwater metagenome TaxID=449393 RepID=A0A6J5ZZH6_9ZZZZ|nr:hypothetical protein [Actinomycetota bacterium]